MDRDTRQISCGSQPGTMLNEIYVTCLSCNVCCRKLNDIVSHVLLHPPFSSFLCLHCDTVLDYQHDVIYHLTYNHGMAFKCPCCQEIILDLSDMWKHFYAHSGNDSEFCELTERTPSFPLLRSSCNLSTGAQESDHVYSLDRECRSENENTVVSDREDRVCHPSGDNCFQGETGSQFLSEKVQDRKCQCRHCGDFFNRSIQQENHLIVHNKEFFPANHFDEWNNVQNSAHSYEYGHSSSLPVTKEENTDPTCSDYLAFINTHANGRENLRPSNISSLDKEKLFIEGSSSAVSISNTNSGILSNVEKNLQNIPSVCETGERSCSNSQENLNLSETGDNVYVHERNTTESLALDDSIPSPLLRDSSNLRTVNLRPSHVYSPDSDCESVEVRTTPGTENDLLPHSSTDTWHRCEMRFGSIRDFRDQVFCCTQCGEKFRSSIQFKQHLTFHKKEFFPVRVSTSDVDLQKLYKVQRPTQSDELGHTSSTPAAGEENTYLTAATHCTSNNTPTPSTVSRKRRLSQRSLQDEELPPAVDNENIDSIGGPSSEVYSDLEEELEIIPSDLAVRAKIHNDSLQTADDMHMPNVVAISPGWTFVGNSYQYPLDLREEILGMKQWRNPNQNV